MGLGPIGAAVARQIVSRKGFQIVGAVDIDRGKIGLDLGEVIGLEKKLKVRVTNDAVGRDQERQARCRGALHQLVAEEGDAADRGGA